MKIEFKITKAVKKVSLDDDGVVIWVSSCVIPICATFLLLPFIGPGALFIGIASWLLQILIGGAMMSSNVPGEISFFFCWIPLVLLAPITIPLDIFSSVSKGIWNWFSKKKTSKAIKKSWQHLLEKGLNDRKFEIDLFDSEKDLSKNIERLFEEIITDQLGRSIFKRSKNGVSEKIKIVRFEKTGDKISLIGSFTITEKQTRADGSENSTVKGRVFGITFSVSEHTGVCKVFHHTSRTLQEVHEDEHLEDLWFDLLTSSGIESKTASDPWQRRMQKCVIVPDENSVIQPSQEAELE